MPTSQLYTVSIPRSSPIDLDTEAKPDLKLPLYLQPLKSKPRTYPDEPLPVEPSLSAPRKARILNRINDYGQIKFDIAIGGVKLNDVRLEEILDYVSPADLEEYEHRAFEEEEELLRITLEADAQRRQEDADRRKERAKRKGEVVWKEVSGGESAEDGEERGRPRPSYKQVFEVARMRRRRRKRDPVTGELLDLSDRDDGLVTRQVPEAVTERRRVKAEGGQSMKSMATLKLLEKPKRKRRRRHPQTGELMPYGWKYDPEAEAAAVSGKGAAMPSIHRLSLSQQQGEERESKRQRMDLSTSSSLRSRSPVVQLPSSQRMSSSAAHGSPRIDKGKAKATSALSSFQQHAAISITDSSEDDSADGMPPPSTVKPAPAIVRRSTGGAALHRQISTSDQSTQSSDDDELPQTSLKSPTRRAEKPGTPIQHMQQTTSIIHPTANSPPGDQSESDEDDYNIEGVLDHALSDPRTHPSDFGKKPIMLYLVKWEGYEEPSWEPETSFGDMEVVHAYRKRAGLASLR